MAKGISGAELGGFWVVKHFKKTGKKTGKTRGCRYYLLVCWELRRTFFWKSWISIKFGVFQWRNRNSLGLKNLHPIPRGGWIAFPCPLGNHMAKFQRWDQNELFSGGFSVRDYRVGSRWFYQLETSIDSVPIDPTKSSLDRCPTKKTLGTWWAFWGLPWIASPSKQPGHVEPFVSASLCECLDSKLLGVIRPCDLLKNGEHLMGKFRKAVRKWRKPNCIHIWLVDSCFIMIWLVVYLPLRKMMEWKSVGMMTFPTEWKVIIQSMVPVSTNQYLIGWFKVDSWFILTS